MKKAWFTVVIVITALCLTACGMRAPGVSEDVGPSAQREDADTASGDEILEQNGYSFTDKDFQNAIWAGNAEAVQAFLDEGMDPDTTDETGRPVMYAAIDFNQAEVIRLLCDYGANVQYESEYGGNYLYYAVMNLKENETLDALLAGGVDLYYSYDGYNSLDVAMSQLQYDQEYQRLIDYLTDKGLAPLK